MHHDAVPLADHGVLRRSLPLSWLRPSWLRPSESIFARPLTLMLAAALSSACSGVSTAEAPPSSVTAPEPTPERVVPPTSLVGLDDPPPVPDELVVAGPLSDAVAPAHGCVLATDAPQPVLEGASATDAIAVGGGFVVAAYTGSPEVVALARIAPGGAPSPLGRIELGGSASANRRTAPPVLARLGEATLGVALVDGAGGVRLARFEVGAPAPAIREVQVTPSGADIRYPLALANVDAGTLIAWTEPSGTTAHVRVALVDAAGVLSSVIDLTPEAGAAAAPVFDAHGVLYMMDARAGISVVHRTPFGADGAPGETTVAQPLNLTAEPPSFAVVGTQLAYTAVGNAATRAVGLVTMGSAARARALVPGLGYGGGLMIDAAPLGDAGLFAMEAPSAVDASAPHETRLRVVSADESIGDAITIGGMIEPRIAVASGGIVAIAGRGAGIYWARCAQ